MALARSNKSNRLPTNVSSVADLPRYFDKYTKFLKKITFKSKGKYSPRLLELLGLNEEDFDKLKGKFSPDLFSWKNIQPDKGAAPREGFHPSFKLYEIPKETKLRSLQVLLNTDKKILAKNERSDRYAGQYDIGTIPEGADDKGKERLKDYSDYILTVRIFIPGKHHAFSETRKTEHLRVSHELLVYGNQTLDKLRDRIICPEDVSPAEGDVSQNPFEASVINNESVYRSAMFFINNVFYIDERFPGNIDYSQVVKDWAKGKNLNCEETQQMEQTKFNTIKFRLGYPYLYTHQGSCEHLIMFTDARLCSARDVTIKTAYPLLKSYASLRGKTCLVCSRKVAKFVVIDTEKLPDWKTHICGFCLHQYLYIDGKKVDNFTVYKYVDRVALF